MKDIDGMFLACPVGDCDDDFEVSAEDPDATLTEIMHHLQGWPHYRAYGEAKELLARVEEVRR